MYCTGVLRVVRKEMKDLQLKLLDHVLSKEECSS